jgi:hypothetical protein
LIEFLDKLRRDREEDKLAGQREAKARSRMYSRREEDLKKNTAGVNASQKWREENGNDELENEDLAMEEPQENDRMLDSSSESEVGGKPLKVNKRTSKEKK